MEQMVEVKTNLDEKLNMLMVLRYISKAMCFIKQCAAKKNLSGLTEVLKVNLLLIYNTLY